MRASKSIRRGISNGLEAAINGLQGSKTVKWSVGLPTSLQKENRTPQMWQICFPNEQLSEEKDADIFFYSNIMCCRRPFSTNFRVSKYYTVQKRRETDFKALILRKDRPGCTILYSFKYADPSSWLKWQKNRLPWFWTFFVDRRNVMKCQNLGIFHMILWGYVQNEISWLAST